MNYGRMISMMNSKYVNWWRVATIVLACYCFLQSCAPFSIRPHGEELAITYCIPTDPNRISIVFANGISSDEKMLSTEHEIVHIRQYAQLGCKAVSRMLETPMGQLTIESEAYCETYVPDHVAIDLLMEYPEIKKLSRETVTNFYKQKCVH